MARTYVQERGSYTRTLVHLYNILYPYYHYLLLNE